MNIPWYTKLVYIMTFIGTAILVVSVIGIIALPKITVFGLWVAIGAIILGCCSVYFSISSTRLESDIEEVEEQTYRITQRFLRGVFSTNKTIH